MKSLMRLLACALCLSLGGTASANTSVWTAISYQTPNAQGSPYIQRAFEDITARAQLSWSDSLYSISAASEAGHGFILADAVASSRESGHLGHFMNNVYVDWLTLSHPELAGQSGQVKMSFYFENDMTVAVGPDGQSNTSVNWYAYGDNASVDVYETYNAGPWAAHNRWTYIDDASGTSQGPIPFDEQYLTLTLNFVWGEPFRFGYGIASQGQAVGESSYELAHLGYFAGITEVTAGGIAIDGYSLASRSGTDYSQPTLPVPEVPEPDSIALWAAGLGLIVSRQLRRKATSPTAVRSSATS